jgi:hypothetical protein
MSDDKILFFILFVAMSTVCIFVVSFIYILFSGTQYKELDTSHLDRRALKFLNPNADKKTNVTKEVNCGKSTKEL